MTYISNLSNTVGNIDNIELIRKVDDKENWWTLIMNVCKAGGPDTEEELS